MFVAASCALVYELIAGAVSSYLLGDAVTQFSLVIGIFLSAMGVGSYVSKFFTKNLLPFFINIEILIGLAGGFSSTLMFAVNVYAQPLFSIFFYSLCAFLGIVIGIEVPILIRIVNVKEGLKNALSNVLTFDYIGALIGSILFPLFILPYMGLSRSSVIFGLLNLAVAFGCITLLKGKEKIKMFIKAGAAALSLIILLFVSVPLIGYLEDLLYQDDVIFARTTAYQRIVLTRWRDDIRLYLNGHIQFSSVDEARYHESLVIPAMEAHGKAQKVLILGGGDGMAAREVLKYPGIEQIVLVDIDPMITDLAKNRPELTGLNKNSLGSEKVTVFNTDGMKYLEETDTFFDVIIIDLPDPNTEGLSKLYSTSFYTLCKRRLTIKGVLVTQATSPFYATRAFWCIAKTIEAESGEGTPQMQVYPYHVNVPSFGEWGFVLASKFALDTEKLSPSVETAFLSEKRIGSAFVFGKDMLLEKEVEVNRLTSPVLFTYYQQGWRLYNQ